MKFARIEMLFLIWVIPVLVLIYIYGFRKRKKILSGFSSAKGLAAISPEAGNSGRKIRAVLVLSGLAFLVLALSGPQYGFKWQDVERKGIDIIIALDCSKSMLAEDIKPTRLDRAKREIYDLLNMLQGDRVGMVSFAGSAFLQCPLTLDYNSFYLFLHSLTPDLMPVGGTDLGAAIVTALSGFSEKDNSEKAVILITDGESTGEDPVKAAKLAAEAGIKVFCIGVGQENGAPVPDEKGGLRKDKTGKIIMTKLDEETLKKVAEITGASYVRSVAGDMDLEAIYTREIRGKMETTTLSSGKKKIWEDRYQWFLGIAFVLFMLELFYPLVKVRSKILALFILLLMQFNFVPVSQASEVYEKIQNGLQAYEKGEYENALKNFIDAQLEEPDRPEIYYNIGNAYYKAGQYEDALKNYEQVLKTKDEKLKAKALYNKGNANFRLNRFKEAIQSYEKTLEINPDDGRARKNLEFVKKVMGRKQQPPQQKDDSREKEEKEKQPPGQQKKNESSGEDKEKKNGKDKDKQESNAPSPEYGKELKDNKKEPDGDQKQSGGQEGGDKKEEPVQAKGEKAREGSPGDKKQAERMLNRLQDKPGMGMIPTYRKRHVEKDW